MNDSTPPLVLRDGAIAIDGRPVVRGVDLTVTSGEFVTILGPNGSGKTTLMRGLTGLRPLARGSLELFGTPFGSFKEWGRIGYVPQRIGASGGVPATVREVVTSGRLTRRKLLRPLSRADRAAIADALEVVGLTERASASVSHLSGGQQQRVLIARALAGEPDLLFLDEPTAGVDLPNQVALADALSTLKARGCTVIVVTHEMGPMTPLIDRAVVLRDGLISYDGPPLTVSQAHSDLSGLPGGTPDRATLPGLEIAGHHPDCRPKAHDHAPHVASPLDSLGGEA